MICFQLTTTTPDTIRAQLDFVEDRIARFWASSGTARILCHVRAVDLGEQVESVALSDDWRRRYQQELRDALVKRREPTYRLDTYLALWNSTTRADVIQEHLPGALLIPAVQQVPFPAIVSGDYRAHSLYLEPTVKGKPYLAVLTAYDLQGGWAPAPISVKVDNRVLHCENWHALLRLNMPLTLAIDVQPCARTFGGETGLPRTVAQQRANLELAAAAATSAVHAVRYAILLQAQRVPELERHVQQVQQLLGRRVALERMRGAQERTIAFFQPIAPERITVPIHVRETPSHTLACQTPNAVRRTPRHVGISLGEDVNEVVPVNVELFGADGRQNPSALVVGMPGFGKSVLLNKLALEHATFTGGQTVVIDPGEDAWRLRDAVADETACAYHTFTGAQALNILDPQEANAAQQYLHVLDALKIALGRVEEGGVRWTMKPRVLTRAEERAVRRALFQPTIYGEDGEKLSTMTAADAPLLRDLVPVLRTEGADELADDIAGELVELAPSVWDRRTQLRFDPSLDINLFHVTHVPRPLLPLWYKRIFDQVYRYVLTRHERRPLLIICDEWWIASMLDTLRARGIAAAKDLRKYRAGIIFADQHAEVYFTGDATLPGIAGAVRHKFFFHLEGRGVQLIQEAYGQQLPAKLAQQLPTLDRGECVAMVDGETRKLRITLRDQQKAHLLK